jgi:nitroimidazol reductase NimA-like FMN-containing flavoprotein (pyridoxamine 5'-phosphate oxidase superfamily)
MTSHGLHILDEAECYPLLRSRTLGRVGVRLGEQLSIFPVYYAVMDHDVVFRTAPGTKLDAAVLGTRTVFEVDNASPGWSVVVRGHALEIRDADALVHAASLLGHDWPAGEREHYVRLVAEQVTGRRLPQSA